MAEANHGGVSIAAEQQPTKKAKPFATRLASCAGRSLCVKLVDGRTLVGRFYCFDKQKNLILQDCTEYNLKERRTCGFVLISRKHLLDVQIEVAPAARILFPFHDMPLPSSS